MGRQIPQRLMQKAKELIFLEHVTEGSIANILVCLVSLDILINLTE